MTRFGFLSLAILSLQAFVGTGFAAVSSLSWVVSSWDSHDSSRLKNGFNWLTGHLFSLQLGC